MVDEPRLEAPDAILRHLLVQCETDGRAREKTYLRSVNPGHRWGRSSFSNLNDEFRYKTIWVAKRLREKLGSPDHLAFVALGRSRIRGVRAAVWFLGPFLGYCRGAAINLVPFICDRCSWRRRASADGTSRWARGPRCARRSMAARPYDERHCSWATSGTW
jgi:hypothetical protein